VDPRVGVDRCGKSRPQQEFEPRTFQSVANGVLYCAEFSNIQGGSNMTGTDLCVNKPHCAAAVRP